MSAPTISALARVERCPASAMEPHVEVDWAGPDRARGEAIHAFAAAVLESGRDAALAACIESDWLDLLEAIDVTTLPHGFGSGAVEVALAWHPETGVGVELGRGVHARDYSRAPPGSLCGTADWLAIDGDRLWVLDLKTGYGQLAAPARALQLLGYAVAARGAYPGIESATLGWLRGPGSDGSFRLWTEEVDVLDLDAAADRIRGVLAAASAVAFMAQLGEEPSLAVGPWCRYCPRFLLCPAQGRNLRGVLGEFLGVDSIAAEIETTPPAFMPDLLTRLDAAELLLKRLRDGLDSYATAHPFALPDGRTYGLVETVRETIDVAGIDELGKLGLLSAVETKRSASKASILRAARALLGPSGSRGAPALQRQAIEAIRAAGHIKTSRSASVKAFDARRLPEE